MLHPLEKNLWYMNSIDAYNNPSADQNRENKTRITCLLQIFGMLIRRNTLRSHPDTALCMPRSNRLELRQYLNDFLTGSLCIVLDGLLTKLRLRCHDLLFWFIQLLLQFFDVVKILHAACCQGYNHAGIVNFNNIAPTVRITCMSLEYVHLTEYHQSSQLLLPPHSPSQSQQIGPLQDSYEVQHSLSPWKTSIHAFQRRHSSSQCYRILIGKKKRQMIGRRLNRRWNDLSFTS